MVRTCTRGGEAALTTTSSFLHNRARDNRARAHAYEGGNERYGVVAREDEADRLFETDVLEWSSCGERCGYHVSCCFW